MTLAGEFPNFEEVDSIEIKDSWDGLTPDAPFKREYSLKRGENSFTGKARFGNGGNSETPREVVRDVEIPLETIRAFLEKIAGSRLNEGSYNHEMDFIDASISISIKIVTNGKPAMVFTRLQGRKNNPWRLGFKGKTFVVESDSPSKALEELTPYFK